MIALDNMSIADAPSHNPIAWHAIDWAAVHGTVQRLQVRIVKAAQAGKWHKVRSLQRLLIHSFSARALAVRRVTENRGKNTPGVDGEVWDTPAKKVRAIERLINRRLAAQPLRRMYIPKANGKMRPLGIPTMMDRACQALHLLGLDPVAEVLGDPNSYGFRRERATADAIEQCFLILARKGSSQWILEADIEACFDRLSHDWLLDHIPMHKATLRKWLKAGYMEKYALHPTPEGSPQGGPISPVLANMALDGLEDLIHKHFPSWRQKVHLVRYADDFIVTAAERATLEEMLPMIEEFLAERGLRLSPTKTTITHINDGFDFLGQTVRKYNGKLLITPARKKQKALLDKVRTLIKTDGRSLSAIGLITRLNPIIRGWANYHRHVVSSQTFSYVDHRIWQMLWRWARRRHHNKPRRWVAEKYFGRHGEREWVFGGVGPDGVMCHLLLANQVSIKRHVKVKGDANPYDQSQESYFEARQMARLKENRRWFGKLRLIWARQKHRCPLCGQPFRDNDDWDLHHIVYKTRGGGDEAENLMMLHPNCHRQYHAKMDGDSAGADLE